MLWYGPLSYFRLGRVYPRSQLREPYLRPLRAWRPAEVFIPAPPAPGVAACPSRPARAAGAPSRPARAESSMGRPLAAEESPARPARPESSPARPSRAAESPSRPSRPERCR